jgi:hypothetical protein
MDANTHWTGTKVGDYYYDIGWISKGLWMVKRSKTGDFTTDTAYKECMLKMDEVPNLDANILIEAAIKQDQWA